MFSIIIQSGWRIYAGVSIHWLDSHQKSAISRSRKDIWYICPENETNQHVTSTTNVVSEANWTNNRKIIILCEGGIKHMPSPVIHDDNKTWPPRTRWEKFTPISGLHGNISKYSGQISRFRHDFKRRHQWVIFDWTGSTQLRCSIFFLREYTFKVCAGAPKWTNTCKLQYLKKNCRFCCRSRNRGVFCDRKRCHNSTKNIRRNGPTTAHYTSMQRQYSSLCNWKQYNQATAITCNEYAIFSDFWPKNLKIFSLQESRTRKSCGIFYKESFCKTS